MLSLKETVNCTLFSVYLAIAITVALPSFSVKATLDISSYWPKVPLIPCHTSLSFSAVRAFL